MDAETQAVLARIEAAINRVALAIAKQEQPTAEDGWVLLGPVPDPDIGGETYDWRWHPDTGELQFLMDSDWTPCYEEVWPLTRRRADVPVVRHLLDRIDRLRPDA